MKIIRAVLPKSVLIAGDHRNSWDSEKDGSTLWLEGNVLHIERKGVHFCTTTFVGAWGEPEVKLLRKARAETAA